MKPATCVVGSGPAAAACAAGLIERGIKPVILDAGLELQDDLAARIAEIRSKESDQWNSLDRETIRGTARATASGIPLKLLFGSDFPYRVPDCAQAIEIDGVGLHPSFAFGGLSNVWGAAILPHRDADIATWPTEARKLERHYRAVAALTGVAAVRDELESLFPLYTEELGPLEIGNQCRDLLSRFRKNADVLHRRGIRFGRARLAVQSHERRSLGGCRHCGMCLYGCPYGIIFNSADIFRDWSHHGAVDYRSGLVVELVRESRGVRIQGRNVKTNEPFSLHFDRVFLAAGLLGSTRIILESLNLFNKPVRASDSQYFVVPFVSLRGGGDVQSEPLLTLSQLFVEIDHIQGLHGSVHLQLYPYNDLVREVVFSKFGSLTQIARPLIDRLLNRLMIIQGYLHSDDSSGVDIEIFRRDSRSVLQVRPVNHSRTKKNVRRALRSLSMQAFQLRAAPVLPMLSIGEPGRGFHTGGTFPMSENPTGLQTDVYGRLPQFRNVYLVDASVLPSVPATTITFPMMANAHRIATTAPFFSV